MIRVEDGVCPICNSTLFEIEKSKSIEIIACKYDCYYFYSGLNFISVMIFDMEQYYQSKIHSKLHSEKTKENLISKIEYWKENDRYLIKIMERKK